MTKNIIDKLNLHENTKVLDMFTLCKEFGAAQYNITAKDSDGKILKGVFCIDDPELASAMYKMVENWSVKGEATDESLHVLVLTKSEIKTVKKGLYADCEDCGDTDCEVGNCKGCVNSTVLRSLHSLVPEVGT